MFQKQSEAFIPSLKQNFVAYRSSKVSSRPDSIFEIHQLWQPGFSRVYSNCCCSCSFELEIIKIGQSSHKMYNNDILNFQVSTTILNVRTKKVWKLIEVSTYVLWKCIIYFSSSINLCAYIWADNFHWPCLRNHSQRRKTLNSIHWKIST